MIEKRTFEALDAMNIADMEDSKGRVAACFQFISADKVKGGCKVAMGAPESAIFNIVSDEVMPVLLLINKKDYEEFKVKKEASND